MHVLCISCIDSLDDQSWIYEVADDMLLEYMKIFNICAEDYEWKMKMR
jgi:hypothetical protein